VLKLVMFIINYFFSFVKIVIQMNLFPFRYFMFIWKTIMLWKKEVLIKALELSFIMMKVSTSKKISSINILFFPNDKKMMEIWMKLKTDFFMR